MWFDRIPRRLRSSLNFHPSTRSSTGFQPVHSAFAQRHGLETRATIALMAEAPPGKSWQARISESTDAIAQSFVESMSYDWRLYKVDVAGSIAHATMLAKVGLITDADRDAIVKGLKEIEAEIDRDGPKWAGFKPELEDIHMCVESELTARIGEPGRKLHTGRSRNDQVALDLSLWIRGAVDEVQSKLVDLLRSFVLLAQRSRDVVMPSFTHMQRAQPISAAAE